MGNSLRSGVGVEAGKEVVGSEIGEEDGEDGRQQVDVEHTRFAEEGEAAAAPVEGQGVDKPHHQGARLLGVPAPVTSPCPVGPHGTDKDAGAQQEYGGGEDEAVEHRKMTAALF